MNDWIIKETIERTSHTSQHSGSAMISGRSSEVYDLWEKLEMGINSSDDEQLLPSPAGDNSTLANNVPGNIDRHLSSNVNSNNFSYQRVSVSYSINNTSPRHSRGSNQGEGKKRRRKKHKQRCRERDRHNLEQFLEKAGGDLNYPMSPHQAPVSPHQATIEPHEAPMLPHQEPRPLGLAVQPSYSQASSNPSSTESNPYKIRKMSEHEKIKLPMHFSPGPVLPCTDPPRVSRKYQVLVLSNIPGGEIISKGAMIQKHIVDQMFRAMRGPDGKPTGRELQFNGSGIVPPNFFLVTAANEVSYRWLLNECPPYEDGDFVSRAVVPEDAPWPEIISVCVKNQEKVVICELLKSLDLQNRNHHVKRWKYVSMKGEPGNWELEFEIPRDVLPVLQASNWMLRKSPIYFNVRRDISASEALRRKALEEPQY